MRTRDILVTGRATEDLTEVPEKEKCRNLGINHQMM